ncbi:MAG TPA: NAD(P)/FAD-dependent oxidoreductase [Acidimicrobiales bacterium]|nr:NAD(P)/FAD-dependent oxidoreductase [Acidimicrobiales bacterium]
MEHLDVVVVGAGLSGVCAGHYLQQDCPWATFAIFEARGAMGGTWDLFRYPGVRSDSDMFTLGFPFRPWRGSRMIVDGTSIREYIAETAREEGLDARIRYHHRVVSAAWDSGESRWHLEVERTDTGERVEVTCGFLLSCSGYYRYDHGYQPDFAGTERFRGALVHPQHWPEELDYEGKRVVVIGSGATAITVVPAMAADAEHVTMLQRSPTYIASVPASNPLVGLAHRVLPGTVGPQLVRWAHALGTQGFYTISQRFPGIVRRVLQAGVKRQLPRGYDMAHFTPRYDPWDERMCVVPGGDLFDAIKRGRASVVTDHVDTFTETGIQLSSGTHLDADVVVTATGLELLFLGGIDLRVDGEPVDLASRLTYKGMMLEGVPNLAIAMGYTNASWTLKCDLTAQYVTRLLNHLHENDLARCVPRNHDPAVAREPLLGLQSGYIQRAVDRMPQQGSKFPWRVYQSFLSDYRAMKLGKLDDGVMEFDSPAGVAGPRAVQRAG